MFFIVLMRGEWFLVLLVLFVMAGIPVMIGTIVWYQLRKNKMNRAAWLQLAKEIQFRMPDPKRLEMFGNYNGIQTRLAIGMRSHGSGEDRYTEYFTYCTSEFPRPLRFAMRVSSPKGMVKKLFKGSGLSIGHDAFDKIFGLQCYNAEILKRLLLAPFPSNKTANLMGDLMLASQSYDTITLTDNSVYIETESHIRDHDELKKLLQVTNGVARRFAEARAKFPLTEWEESLIRNWTAFADRHSIKMSKEEFTLSGIYNGFPLQASLASEPGKWKTVIELRFPEKLMVGFSIYPEAPLYAAIKLFGFQDIKTGHKEFDDAFIVKAKNVLVAKAKMTGEFCSQMVGLDRNSSAIELDDEKMKITVDQVLGDEKTLASFLDAMARAMSKLQ